MGVERFHVLGIDHHRSPIALRERMAIPPAELDAALADLCEVAGVAGAVVLSTCNRSEFYLGGEVDVAALQAFLAERQGVVTAELTDHCYAYHGAEAVRHLFRVVGSLESMVVGEYQIMHQVRHAFEQARLHGALDPFLDRVFQRALAAGKAVRNETAIGRYKLSMASIAVDLAEHIHGRLHDKRLLVIGAGEMAELAVIHFLDRGLREVTVINRHRERALELSRQHAGARHIATMPWSELPGALGSHDVVLASTAANHAIITPDMVDEALGSRRRRRRVMFIDLAVPRDVDPAVSEVDEAYVYNVDDLEQVVEQHRELRDDELADAEALIDRHAREALQATDDDLNALRSEVAAWFDAVVAAEAGRIANKLDLDPDQQQQAAHALDRVAGKLRHRIHSYLARHTDRPEALALIRELLGR